MYPDEKCTPRKNVPIGKMCPEEKCTLRKNVPRGNMYPEETAELTRLRIDPQIKSAHCGNQDQENGL